MKKILLSLFALVAMCSNAMAGDVTVTFPLTNQVKVSAYSCNWTGEDANGKEWRFVNFNNNNNGWAYIKCGWKTAETTSVVSSPLIAEAVTEYAITVDKTANVTSAKLEVLKSDSATVIETKDVTLAAGTVTVALSGSKDAYYRLTIENEKTSSNGTTQISGLKLTTEGGTTTKKVAGLAWSSTSINVLKGAEFTAPTFTKATTADVNFASSNEDVAEVSTDGVITLGGEEGTANIEATSAENDEYQAGSATCKITVYHNNYYSKVTTIESGAKYLIVAQRNDTTFYAYPISSSKTYGYLSVGNVKKLTDEISIGSNYNDEFTLTAVDGGYTIQDASNRYYYQTGTYRSFNLSDEAQTWSCEPQTDGTFKFSMNGYIMQFLTSGSYTEFALYDALQDGAKLPYLYKYTGTTPTAIAEVNANASTVAKSGKFIQNSRLVIVSGNKKFNVAGQTVK